MMGNLIRREELLASQFVHTECYLQANKDRHYDVYKKGWNDALQDAYDNAPAVDAVEVVRCRDCKHWVRDGNESYGYAMFCKANCSLGGQGIKKPDDFCSYGERKTDV